MGGTTRCAHSRIAIRPRAAAALIVVGVIANGDGPMHMYCSMCNRPCPAITDMTARTLLAHLPAYLWVSIRRSALASLPEKAIASDAARWVQRSASSVFTCM